MIPPDSRRRPRHRSTSRSPLRSTRRRMVWEALEDRRLLSASPLRIIAPTASTTSAHVVGRFGAAGFLEVFGNRGVVSMRRLDGDGEPIGGTSALYKGSPGSTIQVAVASAAAGGSLVAWSEVGPRGRGTIQAQLVSSDGSAATTTLLVANIRGAVHADPVAAMTDDGRGMIAWASAGPGDARGIFGRFIDGSGMPSGQVIRLNGDPAGVQSHPALAPISAGSLAAAWARNGGREGNNVRVREVFAVPPQFGPASRIDAALAASQRTPALAASGDGSGLVAWVGSGADGGQGVFVRPLSGSGPAVRIAAYSAARLSSPSIAETRDGRAAIAYAVKRGRGWDVVVQPIDPAGRPVGPTTTASTAPLPRRVDPSIALDLRGDAYVTWASAGHGTGARALPGLLGNATPPGSGGRPDVHAAIARDTGRSATDGVTSDPAIAGSVVGTGPAYTLSLIIDGKVRGAVSVPDGSAGHFLIDRDALDRVAGGLLTDGMHTVQITAMDSLGRSSDTVALAFVLDTTPPSVSSFGLDPASDTGTLGDGRTTSESVILTGLTEPGASVTLVETGATTLAAADGSFSFSDLPLTLGTNSFTALATDAAGNSSSTMAPLTRTMNDGQTDSVLNWDQVAIEVVRQDGATPPSASRAFAMASLAVLDSLNAIGGSAAYMVARTAPAGTSDDAAVAGAAYRVLSYLFPARQDMLDAALADSLSAIPDGPARLDGLALGESIADAVIAIRSADGWDSFAEPNTGTDVAGEWRPTGPMYEPGLQPQWADLKPFAMTSADQFQPAPPPALDSVEYATAVNEIERLGRKTGSERTADQTQIARFWADGAGTDTPPGHWNRIANQVAATKGGSLADHALMLAEMNVALADAGITAWNAKYEYRLWRPATAITLADEDGNPATTADPTWEPLLITPNFPEYISGHSTFSGAAAEVLDEIYGTNVGFSIDSLGLPGVRRSFANFDAAAAEAGRSRVYGGIHFEFSNQEGQSVGHQVGSYVMSTFSAVEDATAPRVHFTSPKDGSVVASDVTISGQVLDYGSGVASLEYQVDAGAFVAIPLDALGNFRLSVTLPDGGAHLIQFRATDKAGNISLADALNLVADSEAPALSLDGPDDGAAITAGSAITGKADGTGSALVALSYQLDDGPTFPMAFDALGAFSQAIDLSLAAVGTHRITVSATDGSGRTTTLTRTVHLDTLVPFRLAGMTPLDGAEDVGVTYRPKITFSRPVDPATLSGLTVTDASGTPISATVVPAQDDRAAWIFFAAPLPGGTRISLHIDGSMVKAAGDGQALDADGDGVAGGRLDTYFTTVMRTPLAGTTIVGRIVDPGPDLHPMTFDDIRAGADGALFTSDDVFLHPLAGVKVNILGLEDRAVTTDANGNFRIDAAPPGDVKLAIDGRTATNAPGGVYFPEMVMDLALTAGVVNTVMGSMGRPEEQVANRGRSEVYLPRVQKSILTDIAGGSPVRVTVQPDAAAALSPEQRAQLYVDVTPGSMLDAQGRPMATSQVGISTVPPELVRDMLPPGLIEHTFDITVQAPGVSIFTTPAAMSFPNIFNAAPGTKLNFLSFDHTTGRLLIEGTATVSADGKSVHTDPGSGITHPGWHGLTPPGSPTGPGPTPPPNTGTARREANAAQTTVIDPIVLPFTISSAADPITDPTLTWKAPAKGTLAIKIEIDGPLSTFMKPSGTRQSGKLSLKNQTIVLSRGQSAVTLSMKPKTYDEIIKGGFANIEADELYGAVIRVTQTLDVPGEVPKAEVRTYYLYRWIDATFAPEAEIKEGNGVAFLKTLADGSQGWSSTHTVFAFLPSGVMTDFSTAPTDNPFTNVATTSVQGNSLITWTFDPEAAGLFSEPIAILVNGGKQVGSLLAQGTAVRPTKLSVNLDGSDGYKAELKRVILALHAGPIGSDGLPTVIYDFPASVGDSLQVSARFRLEWAGFMPADRQGPGGTFTQAQLAALDARINTAADDLLAAVIADYSPIAQAVVIQRTNAGADISMKWADLGAGLYGTTSGYDYDLNKMREFVGTLGRKDPITGTKFTAAIPMAAQQWALQEYINQAIADTGTFAVGINLDFSNPNVTFAQFVANTVDHELAHTFGLNEGYLSPLTKTGGSAHVRADGNAPPFQEIMNNGQPTDGDLTFKMPRLGVLQMAVGLWNGTSDPTKVVQLWRDQFNLHLGRPNPDGHRDAATTPLTTPEIALVRDRTEFYGLGDESLDFDTVAADGPGGDASTVVLHLVNEGVAPLVLSSIRLADTSQGFSIDAAGLVGASIEPGASLDLPIRFDPSRLIGYETQLIIDSNAGYAPSFSLGLSGVGYSATPSVQLSSDAGTNLGGATVGGDGVVRTEVATLTNRGKQALEIRGIRLPEGLGAFRLLGVPADLATNPIVLAMGESYTFGARFDADRPGLSRAVVEILTNDPDQPVLRFDLSATGLDATGLGQWGNDYVAFDTPEIANSLTVRTRSDANGNFSVFLPNDTYYEMTIFDPETGLVGHASGVTGASGESTIVGDNLVFVPSDAPDTDFDGLPDDVEHAIGTSPNRRDSDGDGLDDFASVQQGKDPLGGRPVSAGILSQIPLRGEAKAVVVEGATPGRSGNLAFVATGSYGLAIVDVTRTDRPVLLSELDLPGVATDLAIDVTTGLVAVADGAGGLAVVDVSEPTAPKVVRTIDVAASQVEAADGVAYVASGKTVASYDLKQGLQLDQLVFGFDVGGMAREGSFLYVNSADNRLVTISTDGPILTRRGQVTIPGDGRYDGPVFAGGGVAYVVNGVDGIEPASGGVATVDVSNPDNPILLSAADRVDDGRNPRQPASSFAANGSGLGLLIGAPMISIDGTRQPRVDLLDLTDLSLTNTVAGTILLPAAPGNGIVAAGQGLIADGSGGLVVINYLPADTEGKAPTVSILPGLADKPDSGDRSVPEGRPVRLRLKIEDDVQVRSVEVLLDDDGAFGPDGETVAAVDLSFPFEVEFTAPSVGPNPLAGARNYSVRVRVTDTGGNVTTTGVLDLVSMRDTVPPLWYQRDLTDGSTFGAGLAGLPLYFSEPLDRVGITTANFRVLDAHGQPVPGLAVALGGADRVVALSFDPLKVGDYTLAINESAVTDRAGNPLGSSTVTVAFKVAVADSNAWIGPKASGSWSDPANWSAGHVPGPSDNVLIDLPPDGNLVIPDASIRSIDAEGGNVTIIGSVLLATDSKFQDIELDGKLDGAADVTIEHSLLLNGGNLSGTGRLIVATGAELDLTNGFLDGRPISIDGTAKGSGLIRYQRSPTITIETTGSLIASDGFQLVNSTGEVGKLDVFGRLEVDPGAKVILGPQFILEPGSTLVATSGRLRFEGGGVFPAGINTPRDLILALGGPDTHVDAAPVYTFPAGTVSQVDGPFLFGGGRVVIAGDVHLAVADMAGDGDRNPEVVVDGTLTVSQKMGYAADAVGLPGRPTGYGIFSGKGLVDFLPSSIYAPFTHVFRGVTVRSEGELNIDSAQVVALGAGAVFELEGTLTGGDRNGETFYGNFNPASYPSTADEPLDVGVLNVRIPLNLNGPIVFKTTTNIFAGLVASSPTGADRYVTLGGSATIQGPIRTGPHVILRFEQPAISGADPRMYANVVTFAAGDAARVEGALQLAFSSLRLERDLVVGSLNYVSGGYSAGNASVVDPTNISGPGNIEVLSRFDWNGGRISGPGTLTLDAGATGSISGNSAPNDSGLDSVSFTNNGSLEVWAVTLRHGATFVNNGTLTVHPSAGAILSGTDGGTLVNKAIMMLDSIGGATGRVIDVPVVNLAGATIRIDSQNQTKTTFASLDNAGLLSIGYQQPDSGTFQNLEVKGDFTQQSSGTLHVEYISFAAASMYWSGFLSVDGTAHLDGRLESQFVIDGSDATPPAGRTWTLIRFAARDGDFAAYSDVATPAGVAIARVDEANRIRIVSS